MLLLILAMLSTIGTLLLAAAVFFANMMSSAPSAPTQGIGLLAAACAITILLWVGWVNGW
jgi:hypothetical protein